MKKIVMCAALIFSLNLKAKECEEIKIKKENYFKDSVITVKLKGGTEYKFSGNTHKVVVRLDSRLVCREEEKETKRLRNTLYGLFGNGPSDDLKTSRDNNSVIVESSDENYMGIGYSRDVLDIGDASLNIGVQIDSSESVGATIGVSW